MSDLSFDATQGAVLDDSWVRTKADDLSTYWLTGGAAQSLIMFQGAWHSTPTSPYLINTINFKNYEADMRGLGTP